MLRGEEDQLKGPKTPNAVLGTLWFNGPFTNARLHSERFTLKNICILRARLSVLDILEPCWSRHSCTLSDDLSFMEWSYLVGLGFGFSGNRYMTQMSVSVSMESYTIAGNHQAFTILYAPAHSSGDRESKLKVFHVKNEILALNPS